MEQPKVETPIVEKKAIMANSKAKGKSLPKNQKGSQVKGISSEAFLSSLWYSWPYKTKLFQASCS